MATIEVKVPFEDQPLRVVWSDREVKVSGSRNAILYWKSLTLRGMFGVFGHRVDLKNTELSDVLVALQNLLPSGDISIGAEAKAVVDRERKQRKPFPDGARS